MNESMSGAASRPGSRAYGRRGRHGDRALLLGRYRLNRRLGGGGFGTVWLARDQRLDRDVAVKILPPERIAGGCFQREARAAARLAHPGIVTLYEAAVDDDGAYLVSELVHGHPLDWLLDAGWLSDRDVVAMGIALCDALAHAHARGVVHRDVKPSNVLVPEMPATPAQLARLTDFGVARIVGGDSLTRTGDVVGTGAYMPPEQTEGHEAGPQADLYALSLVIYESLTGVNPLRGGTAAQKMRRPGVSLPPLRRQRRDLPRELGQGIDLALRPRAGERGRLDDLRACLEATLDRVNDEPGVVAGSRPRQKPNTQAQEDLPPDDDEANHQAATIVDRPQAVATRPIVASSTPAQSRWPARAAAALAAAATFAWLLAHLLAPAPITPAAAGLLGGVLVLALPRAGWLTLTAAVSLTAVSQGRPGAALMILLAALLPAVLIARAGTGWPLAAGAPALGVLGLAGAWPAVVGLTRGAWRRAALAATGWTWLVLASQLAGADLYLARLPAAPPREVWTASLQVTVHDLLWPLASAGAFTPAAIWALAAVVLPPLVRRRSLVLDVVRVVGWAALVASATAVALSGGRLGSPHAEIIGAIASALVALAPSLRAAWRSGGLDFRSMGSP